VAAIEGQNSVAEAVRQHLMRRVTPISTRHDASGAEVAACWNVVGSRRSYDHVGAYSTRVLGESSEAELHPHYLPVSLKVIFGYFAVKMLW
jgi:hypothetical protein